MPVSAASDDRSPLNTEAVWELLGVQVDRLIEAWELGDPPRISEYVPDVSDRHRRLVMAELIKVDLEFRWCRRGEPKKLEQYMVELPDLGPVSRLPCDLIYEEWQVRKQAGEDVDPQEYFARFPDQSPDLIALMGLNSPLVTTTRFSREQLEAIDVGQRLDDFDLLTRLGRGAFATVFLARQVSMQRLVALKVSADRSHEPQTLAQLDHPHIVRVYDQRILSERKLRLLYMQYVAGGTLHSAVDAVRRCIPAERSGRLLIEVIDRELDARGESPPTDSRTRRNLQNASWPQAVCWVGARLASALDYAHQRGVLHRDVKPANVLLAADGSPKLVDFNICFNSKLEGVTPAAYFGGSLAYMSPEQLEACIPTHARQPEDLDGRSDVYSLAVLLWELTTGTRPFTDQLYEDDRAATLAQMSEQRRAGVTRETIAQLPRDTPHGMQQVLLRALSPEPSDRFASAGEFARQLELCLRPATQRLLRPSQRNWRAWMRKFPVTVTMMVLSGIIPNAILSPVNIAFNVNGIVEQLSPQGQQGFWQQILQINAVFYSIGVGLGLALFWPVFRAAGSPRHRPAHAKPLAKLRARTLRVGALMAGIILVEWCLSGLVFPLGIRMHLGPEQAFPGSVWMYWIVSQFLYGLLAANLAFFSITFFAVRGMYPVLLLPDTTSEADLAPLSALARRVWVQLAIAATVPLLAVLVLAVLQAVYQETLPFRNPALMLALLSGFGVVGFGVCYGLFQAILADIRALSAAISPTGDPLSNADTSDSFWTATAS